MVLKFPALIQKLQGKVVKAKEREVLLNRHYGYKDDYAKGSHIVQVRWDEMERLLKYIEKQRTNGKHRNGKGSKG